jgi:hypothetical protein
MKCGIAQLAKTTYRKQRRHELYYNINSWQCIHIVYIVVQLGLGHNNGPWVFPVPGNLEFFCKGPNGGGGSGCDMANIG